MLNDVIPLDKNNFGTFGSYVMQDDVLLMHMTPRECLRFAARMKLRIPKEE